MNSIKQVTITLSLGIVLAGSTQIEGIQTHNTFLSRLQQTALNISTPWIKPLLHNKFFQYGCGAAATFGASWGLYHYWQVKQSDRLVTNFAEMSQRESSKLLPDITRVNQRFFEAATAISKTTNANTDSRYCTLLNSYFIYCNTIAQGQVQILCNASKGLLSQIINNSHRLHETFFTPWHTPNDKGNINHFIYFRRQIELATTNALKKWQGALHDTVEQYNIKILEPAVDQFEKKFLSNEMLYKTHEALDQNYTVPALENLWEIIDTLPTHYTATTQYLIEHAMEQFCKNLNAHCKAFTIDEQIAALNATMRKYNLYMEKRLSTPYMKLLQEMFLDHIKHTYDDPDDQDLSLR